SLDRSHGTRADRLDRGEIGNRDELRVNWDVAHFWQRGRHGTARALIGLAAIAFVLAACSGDRMFGERPALGSTEAGQQTSSEASASPAAQREHERILAAYGGAYQDAKLQAEVSTTVNRLVAASERPDMTYNVTLLNSPAVNAFALPTGQLYVT